MSGNPWIDHVRAYAKQHGISYMCAVSDPNCSKSYKEKQKPKAITSPVPTKAPPTKARAMAAVKTLTSPPKTAPAPAPVIVPTTTPAKVTATTPAVKTKPIFNVKTKYLKLVKNLPPEYADYFLKNDSEQDILDKIKLLKSGVKSDKYLQSKDLWRLANPNLTGNSK